MSSTPACMRSVSLNDDDAFLTERIFFVIDNQPGNIQGLTGELLDNQYFLANWIFFHFTESLPLCDGSSKQRCGEDSGC